MAQLEARRQALLARCEAQRADLGERVAQLKRPLRWVQAGVGAVAARAEAGQQAAPEFHISFQDWETFFRVLTPARIALLHYIHAHEVPSVRALSQAIGRDYRRVHTDVEALHRAGLIERCGTALTTDWDGSEAGLEALVNA